MAGRLALLLFVISIQLIKECFSQSGTCGREMCQSYEGDSIGLFASVLGLDYLSSFRNCLANYGIPFIPRDPAEIEAFRQFAINIYSNKQAYVYFWYPFQYNESISDIIWADGREKEFYQDFYNINGGQLSSANPCSILDGREATHPATYRPCSASLNTYAICRYFWVY